LVLPQQDKNTRQMYKAAAEHSADVQSLSTNVQSFEHVMLEHVM
jgi:hypothetical protein